MGGKHILGTFEDAVEALREYLPPACPVIVKRREGMKLAGECSKTKRKFYININKDLPEDAQVLILLHEWAHALVWDTDEWLNDEHSAVWGVAYAKTYSEWLKN